MIKKILECILKSSLIIAILFAYIVMPFTVGAADVPKSSKATTIKELKAELESLKQEKRDAENEKKQTQSEINYKTGQVSTAYKDKNQIAKDVEDAEETIRRSNIKIEETTEQINESLRFQQISNGENAALEYIGGASSFDEFILRSAVTEQLTKWNKEQLDNLNDMIKQNEELKVELAAKNDQLNQKIANLSTSIKSLGSKLNALSDMNEDIDSQIKNQSTLIDYYKKVCSSETQKLTSCVDLASAPGWLRPLVKGRLTSLAGYRINPLNGQASSFHNAHDIGGNPEGTKVYAPAIGRVAAISVRTKCGGNIVYIHHNINGKAYTTQFAHLLTIGKIKVGDMVDVNTIVGTVGGGAGTRSYDQCSTGAHLHYGVATGHYLGGGATGYSSWSTYLAHTVTPPGFPGLGVWWYKR